VIIFQTINNNPAILLRFGKEFLGGRAADKLSLRINF